MTTRRTARLPRKNKAARKTSWRFLRTGLWLDEKFIRTALARGAGLFPFGARGRAVALGMLLLDPERVSSLAQLRSTSTVPIASNAPSMPTGKI